MKKVIDNDKVPCVKDTIWVGVQDLHLIYNLEFIVRQLVELYMKAVNSVGAYATIKLA